MRVGGGEGVMDLVGGEEGVDLGGVGVAVPFPALGVTEREGRAEGEGVEDSVDSPLDPLPLGVCVVEVE